MKKLIALMIVVFACFGIINDAYAQGEAAVPFLLISPGARPGGMGEAGVALANDATAVYWNPGGLAFQFQDPEVDYRGEVTFMHSKWLPQFNFDDLFYDYLAARYYIEDIGMLATSITFLNLGENIWTSDTGDELGTFDSNEWAFSVAYATKLKPNLGMGINAKIIQSNLSPKSVNVGTETGDGQATAFAVDVGVLWTPAWMFLRNKLNLGANLSNFGPKITYIDKAQADPLPTNLRLGLAYKVLDDEFNRITLIYDINRLLVYRDADGSDNVLEAVFYSSWVKGKLSERLKRFTHSLGLEYWYGNLIALRAGYFYEDPKYGDRNFLTFGGGLLYSIFGFDFGYISASEDHPLSDTMRFSLSVKF